MVWSGLCFSRQVSTHCRAALAQHAESLCSESPDQAEAGWNDFAAQMPPKLHDWWMNEVSSETVYHTSYFDRAFFQCLPQYDTTVDDALGKGVKKSIWHLQLLATHPDYQKCGIGEALVKHKERLVSTL